MNVLSLTTLLIIVTVCLLGVAFGLAAAIAVVRRHRYQNGEHAARQDAIALRLEAEKTRLESEKTRRETEGMRRETEEMSRQIARIRLNTMRREPDEEGGDI